MTIYNNKILVSQRRTQSKFIIDNYFPVINSDVNLISESIEADNSVWSLNDGVTPVSISGVTGTTLTPRIAAPLMQSLQTVNRVGNNVYTKFVYPIYAPTRVYSDIVVDKEIIRIGESVTISAVDFNTVSGSTPSYLFRVYDSNSNALVKILTNKINTTTFSTLGAYDIVLEITTNGSIVKQTIRKLLTVTPSLSNIGDAIICELVPVTQLVTKQDFGDSNISAGSTIIIRLPVLPPEGSMYRLSLNNLQGTALNPIVITFDSNTQIEFNFNSYYGFLMYNCQHVIFDGRGYNNLKYGIHITKYESTDIAITGFGVGYLCSDIQIFGVEISKASFAGLLAKTDPNPNDPTTWRENYSFNNFSLHHNYFHDTSSEGNYIGYFSPETHTALNSTGGTVTYRAHEMRSAKIYRNTYLRTGWDSIQLNNGTTNCEICYNDITDASIYPEADQASFMSLSMDGSIHHNTMANSGGVGIQFGSFTGIDIYNNTMTGVATGYSGLLLLSSINVPEQYGTNGTNSGTTINVYNNTILCSGTFFNAQNVVQFSSVYVKNNLLKYEGSLFSGQDTVTEANWIANAESNFRITDDGSAYQLANIDDNDLQISSNSNLIDTGVNFGSNDDIRGFEKWNVPTKHIGAFSGYRRLSQSILTLTNFNLNSSGITTSNRLVTVSYASIGSPTQYMIGEDPSLIGSSWIDITGGTITYTLTEPDGLKTVYFKLKNASDAVSSILSYSINLNRQKRILVDIGSSNASYQTGTMGNPQTTDNVWNNLYSAANATPVATGNTVSPLVDVSGAATSFSMVVSTSFSDWEANGGADNPLAIYPYTAYKDSFIANFGTVGELTLLNLNPANLYTVKCFGARGFTSNRTIYTIDGVSQPLLTQNNISSVVTFSGVSPDINNNIIIRVGGTAGYPDTNGYISVLDIYEQIV